MKLSDIPAPAWYALAALIAGGALLYLARRGVGQVATAVNPLNHDNIFAASVNAAGAALSGADEGEWSLGAWLADKVHGADDRRALGLKE